MAINSLGTSSPFTRWILATRKERSRPQVLALVFVLMAGVLALDVLLGPGREPAALYSVPVLLAAALGVRSALLAATAATVLYHVTLWHHLLRYAVVDISQTAVFYLLAYTMGRLVNEHILLQAASAHLGAVNAHLSGRIQEYLTGEHKAHDELRQNEGLTELGRAAAQIVHEVKNPLVAIGGFARRVHRQLPEDHPARDDIDIVIEETSRLERLLLQVLDFSRPMEQEHRVTDIGPIIHSVVNLVASDAGSRNVSVAVSCTHDDLQIVGNPDGLKRVLLNLVLNGIDAMPKGGKLTIEAELVDQLISLTVIDEGTGIDEEHVTKVLEPFFTTKSNGTGLGLPMVKKILDNHGGKMEILPHSPCGTRVCLSIPAAKSRADLGADEEQRHA